VICGGSVLAGVLYLITGHFLKRDLETEVGHVRP
jgi:hypothetical protein